MAKFTYRVRGEKEEYREAYTNHFLTPENVCEHIAERFKTPAFTHENFTYIILYMDFALRTKDLKLVDKVFMAIFKAFVDILV